MASVIPNLGNYAGQLGLNRQQQQPTGGQLQQAAQSSLGALGTNAVAQNPYAQPQQQASSGWGNTQKYMGIAGGLQSQNSGGKKNGLSKVLGLVSLFG